jgi:beta-lactamase regulating signal transducer with metallopeptidase domain
MVSLLLESAVRSFFLGLFVWIALRAMRVRNIQIQLMAWTGVLLAGLCMPLLMRWPAIHIPTQAVSGWKLLILSNVYSQSSFASHVASAQPVSQPVAEWTRLWAGLMPGVYATVAGALLLRLLIGLILAWRLRNLSQPLQETWKGNLDVRVSPSIRVPVTVATTIILPSAYPEWTPMKREAVMSHEGSHARRGDFFFQLLAGINRAIFWFSPFSWWLWAHLAKLAEAASDDAAIIAVRDRSRYAEILLEFARTVQLSPVGVPMARPSTVRARIERILEGSEVSARMSGRKQALFAIALAPVIAVCAGFSAGSWRAKPEQSTQAGSPASAPASGSPAADQTPSPDAKRTGQPLWVRIETKKGPYVIVDGESLMINGSGTSVIMGGNSLTIDKTRTPDPQKDESAKVAGDRIWFKQDGKSYIISDPSIVERATNLFRPIEELGRKQGELGSQQGKLGAQQGRLGQKQGELGRHPDQAASEEQTRIGQTQTALGEQQSKLGEEQSRLGEEQTRAAARAIEGLRRILADSLRNGSAKLSY